MPEVLLNSEKAEEKTEKEDITVMRRYADKEKRISEFDGVINTDWILGNRPNIGMYNTMLRDPGISYPLHMLKLPLAKSKITYINEDADIQNFVNENLKELRYTIKNDALMAIDYGYAPFEKRFYHKDSMIYYKEFIALDPVFIWIKLNSKNYRFDALRQKVKMNQKDVPAAKAWLNIHEYRFSHMYGRAQIDYAYVPWLLDREFYRYHGVALQEYGLPTLIGTAPEGKRRIQLPDGKVQDMSNIEFMQIQGQSIRSESVIVLPSGEDFNLKALFEKVSGWDFNKDHEFLDNKKALAILLPPELWLRGTSGSYAKSRIQSYWFEQTISALLEELMRFIMRYLVKPIVLMNFWDGKKQPPLGELFGQSPSMYYEEFSQKLVSQQVSQHPERIEWDSIYSSMQLPLNPEDVNAEVIVKEEKPTDIPDETQVPKDESYNDFSIIKPGDIPTSQKTLEEFCFKYYRKGIEVAKEELAFLGYVPISKKITEDIRGEATKLKYMLKKTSNASAVFNVVLTRLRDQGREDTYQFFHETVNAGNYEAIVGRYNKDDN